MNKTISQTDKTECSLLLLRIKVLLNEWRAFQYSKNIFALTNIVASKGSSHRANNKLSKVRLWTGMDLYRVVLFCFPIVVKWISFSIVFYSRDMMCLVLIICLFCWLCIKLVRYSFSTFVRWERCNYTLPIKCSLLKCVLNIILYFICLI